MTTKLYEENAMKKETAATVIGCTAVEQGYALELDQTVLFPEGGGQLSDTGLLVLQDTLPEELKPLLAQVQATEPTEPQCLEKLRAREDVALIDHVSEAKGQILHHSNRPVAAGTRVLVILDWTSRLDHMQQHTGEHILSYAFWRLFQANNIGFHMSEGLVTIDLDKEVTAEQAAKAEFEANAELWENRPINISYMPHTKVAELTMRKKNERLTGMLRIVAVENGDICTCCGTHPPFTGVVGLIKITKLEKHKSGTRVSFLCGRWALADVQNKVNYIAEASNMLSTKEERVCSSITKLKEDLDLLKEKLRLKTQALQEIELAELLANPPLDSRGNRVLMALEEDCDPKAAKALLQKLAEVEGSIAAVLYKNGPRVNYMFSLGKEATGDCRAIIAKANELFQGKGGGSAAFAQGGGTGESSWQDRAKELKAFILG